MSQPIIIFMAALLPAFSAKGQSASVVSWKFDWKPLSANEAMIIAEAEPLSGWHLYSQSVPEGGPMPTRFHFFKNNSFQIIDAVTEAGDSVVEYDSNFEMNITFYPGRVRFFQRVAMLQPSAVVRGMVEYMACDFQQCIFEKKFFDMPMKR